VDISVPFIELAESFEGLKGPLAYLAAHFLSSHSLFYQKEMSLNSYTHQLTGQK
jgi:hypothetical protein